MRKEASHAGANCNPAINVRLTSVFRLSLMAGIFAFCFCGAVRADTTIFTDLGSGTNVYQHGGGGWDATGPSSGQCNYGCGYVAFSFTPTASTDLSSVQVGLGYMSGNNSVTVALLNDASGSPGTVLDSWNISGLPSALSCCTLETVNESGNVPLLAGTTYWLTVKPGAADTFAIWQYNYRGGAVTGTGFVDQGQGWFNNGSFDVLPAFQVNGSDQSSTPEPSTLCLTSGIVILASRRQSLRRKANALAA